MKKIVQFLTSKIKYILFIYFLLQIVLIQFSEINYKSDALYYYKLAQECLQSTEFYPASFHLYEDYIVAPFYVNITIVILKIYNSTVSISLFNLLLTLLQLFVLYRITEKLFPVNIARLTLILYIFYINTIGLVLSNYTELFFLLLVSTSIYYFLLNKYYYLLFSGLMLGGAIAVRPAGWALLIALLLMQIYQGYKTRKILPSYFYVYIGVLIFIFIYGGWTYSHFGKFEFTSTTGPVNLLIGANETATGGFNSTVFENGNAGHIENPDTLTYYETGEFYQKQAIEWIYRHPVKWISLAPLKVLHTFGWDDIAISSLIGFEDLNFGRAIKNLFAVNKLTSETLNVSGTPSFHYFLFLSLNHIYYYLVLIAILLGIFLVLKNRNSNDGVYQIILFSLISVFMIMITVGTPRYKYPVFILLLPFAAYYIQMKLGLSSLNSNHNESG